MYLEASGPRYGDAFGVGAEGCVSHRCVAVAANLGVRDGMGNLQDWCRAG